MFKSWWRKLLADRARRDQEEATTIVEARREAEHDPRDPDDLSDVGKLPPAFNHSDWTGGPL